MTKSEIITALSAQDFAEYYNAADKLRAERKGNTVLMRALLEFSNHCGRRCAYCGLRCENRGLTRYRMTPAEIISTSRWAVEAGYRTVVLQSGEDARFTPDELCRTVEEISGMGIAVTLSCGELEHDLLGRLREAGASRYLLKHECADERIYAALHPCGSLEGRIGCLRDLKSLGYEVGSGFMVGLPGETLETVAENLLLLKELGCDMAGIGPFLPHPDTPLRAHPPGSAELTRRAVALARLLIPDINLPATTSLSVHDPDARDAIFAGGANVIMQKITPTEYRAMYEIYPSEVFPTDIPADRAECERRIRALGREPL